MATAKKTPPAPLGKELLKKLKAMGITATDEAGARTELLEKLTNAGYEGFEEDTTENLIDIASAIIEDEPAEEAAEEEAEEETGEEETEEAAEEEEEAAPTPVKKGKTKPVHVSDEELDEAVEEATGKTKPVVKKAAAPTVAPAKKATATPKASTPKQGNAFDKGNAEHMKLAMTIFGKIFPKEKYAIGGISGGISIRLLGDNVKIVVLKYSNVTIDASNRLAGNLNFKKIKDPEELQNLLPEAFQDMEIERVDTRGYVRINKISDKQIKELFADATILAAIAKKGKEIDTKMGKNREKLENTLQQGKAKTAPAKKSNAPAEEEEEEEEATPAKKPTPPPTKKVVPAAPAKKAAAPTATPAKKAVAPVKKK